MKKKKAPRKLVDASEGWEVLNEVYYPTKFLYDSSSFRAITLVVFVIFTYKFLLQMMIL